MTTSMIWLLYLRVGAVATYRKYRKFDGDQAPHEHYDFPAYNFLAAIIPLTFRCPIRSVVALLASSKGHYIKSKVKLS
jgi:hypothetical protein